MRGNKKQTNRKTALFPSQHVEHFTIMVFHPLLDLEMEEPVSRFIGGKAGAQGGCYVSTSLFSQPRCCAAPREEGLGLGSPSWLCTAARGLPISVVRREGRDAPTLVLLYPACSPGRVSVDLPGLLGKGLSTYWAPAVCRAPARALPGCDFCRSPALSSGSSFPPLKRRPRDPERLREGGAAAGTCAQLGIAPGLGEGLESAWPGWVLPGVRDE